MNGETKKKSVGSVLYDDVMGGLRPMIPFVAGGGILMAISFMFGMRIGDNSVNQFAKILYEIGHNNAMLLMIPIFGTYDRRSGCFGARNDRWYDCKDNGKWIFRRNRCRIFSRISCKTVKQIAE